MWQPSRSLTHPPGQNGCYFADNIFRYIFVNEKFCILITNSLKFFPGSFSWVANWQRTSTSLENGLTLNRLQAIIWANADPIDCHIYSALWGDELMWQPSRSLTHWSLRDVKVILQVYLKNHIRLISWALSVELISAECHRTPLMISQHWSR